MHKPKIMLWLHDSNKTASGKPGAVHNEAKSVFLASMSHELRTPLNAVLGYSQVIGLDLEGNLSKTQKQYIQDIIDSGNLFLALVDDILDLALIESNRIAINPTVFDATTIIKELISIHRRSAEDRNISIKLEVENTEQLMIRTDMVRFRQIFINLFSNAIKYNQDGGTIVVSLNKTEDDLLRTTVIDSGVGIEDDKKNQIFGMFDRGVADASVSAPGAGIGLAVAKMLVERLGGRIDFVSQKNAGSTFWFDLPFLDAEEALISVQIP